MSGPNPWLEIPLADYEGHMGAAGVQQLGALSALFDEALRHCRPASLAVLGLAGGNGLERVDGCEATRVVGVDINPAYLAAARERFPALPLELHCLDLSADALAIDTVDLVHAALVLEHAGTGRCLENAAALVAPGGALAVVLQKASATTADVAPTPYPSIQRLASHFALVDGERLAGDLAARGFALEHTATREVPGGKALWMGIFRRRSSPAENAR